MMGSNKKLNIYIPYGDVRNMNLDFKMPKETAMAKVVYIYNYIYLSIYIYIHTRSLQSRFTMVL